MLQPCDFIVVSKDFPTTKESSLHFQVFDRNFNQPKKSEIFENIKRQVVDVVDLPYDYPRMLGESILEELAHQYGWEHFAIVEDSQIFDDGLLLLGYETEEAMKGVTDDNEIGSECLDLAELKQNQVFFEDGSRYDLIPYCIEHQVGLKGKYQNTNYVFPFIDGDIPYKDC